MSFQMYDPVGTMTIDTSVGKVCGRVVETENNQYVAQFLGMPYAKQPLGKLRFKLLEPLDGKLDEIESPFMATQFGKSAVQNLNVPFVTKLPQGEDCIYINVFAPVNKNGDNFELAGQNLPVLVNIHGGGLVIGSGGEGYGNLSSFVSRHQVVGVTFNYRLNVFGFFSCAPFVEENLGFRDQQVALKWKHDNISSFGGNPEQTTIYGCSAGGASVHYHVIHKDSHPYFSRAFASSGLLTVKWSWQTRESLQKKHTKLLGKLGYTKTACEENSEEILEFLQNLPAEAFTKFLDENTSLATLPGVNDLGEGENRMSAINAARKPFFIGVAKDEAAVFIDFGIAQRADNSIKTVPRAIAAEWVSDRLFQSPMKDLLKQLSQIEDYPIYGFLFSYGSYAQSEYFPEMTPEHYGNRHGLDALLFFNLACKGSKTMTGLTDTDHFVNDAMTNLLYNFMTAEEGEINAARHDPKNQLLNHIKDTGIEAEHISCMPKPRPLLTLKFAVSIALLKINPGYF